MDMTDQRMCDNCKCNCYDCCDQTLINIRCPDHSLALDKCSFPQVFVLPQCHGALSPKSSRFNCFQCSNIFKGFFSNCPKCKHTPTHSCIGLIRVTIETKLGHLILYVSATHIYGILLHKCHILHVINLLPFNSFVLHKKYQK